jgi:hypothetical protein
MDRVIGDGETVAIVTPFGVVLVGAPGNAALATLSRRIGGGARPFLGLAASVPTDPIVLARLRALALRECVFIPAARDADHALLQAVERAIAGGGLLALLIPRVELGPPVEGPRVAPQLAAATKTLAAMSATERIAELLRRTPGRLGPDLAASFRDMVKVEALAGIAAAFAVLLATQFLGVGEIADAALAWWAYTQAGLSGIYGCAEALAAVVAAVRAPDEAAFDDAVRRFAEGLALVGIALLTAVVTRAARRRAGGGEGQSAGAGEQGASAPQPRRSTPGAGRATESPPHGEGVDTANLEDQLVRQGGEGGADSGPAGGGSRRFGGSKSAQKWANQMKQRGWTPQRIDDAVQTGQKLPASNNINPSNGATRYVSPDTGQSVVIDNVTGEVIHVGGPGFKY